MTTFSESRPAPPTHPGDVRAVWDGPIVDADVHLHATLGALQPYLEDHWIEFMRERRWAGDNRGDARGLGGGTLVGAARAYPPQAPSSVMARWRREDGVAPGSDLESLRTHVLDPLDVTYAVANCYPGIDSLRHPDFTTALARATNDWLIDQWLERDPRLKASLVLPPRDTEAAVSEIRRVGQHPGFVQVLMPVRSERLYGNRQWHEVLGAMAELDLVLGLHYGGTSEGSPTSTGYPSFYVEEYVGEIGVFWAQITSLLAEGAFQRFPTLRVAVLEGGWTWLPSLWWRLDKDWKGLRRDVPWMQRAPSRVMRERMRFAVAPIDAGPPEHLRQVLAWLETDELLMFATDYPHWHDDDIGALLGSMHDQRSRERLMAGNAMDLYRL